MNRSVRRGKCFLISAPTALSEALLRALLMPCQLPLTSDSSEYLIYRGKLEIILKNETLHGKRSVNYEFALLIQKALGIDAETLLNMQHSYDIVKAKRNRAFMEKLQRIIPFAAASL